jgi:predicted short-subunit dehydrogenase-like oxidoreductase (DUF2520 family)
MISRRSNIAVIGAGKIAYSLVYALVKKNYRVKLIISRSYNAAKFLAGKNSVKSYSDDLTNLDSKIKVVFISVPDGQIKIVADKIANLNINFRNTLFIHLSGTENVSKLNSLKKKGGFTASFHIMQTFPSKRIVKIENCFASIQTENKFAEKYLLKLAENLKLKPFKLDPGDKAAYHLAGVFASNFLVGNMFDSDNIFEIEKIKSSYNNFDFLFPIISSTFDNIKKLGSSKALSGPVERGDLFTIKRHTYALKRQNRNKKLNYAYLSYIVQSLNLLSLVESKYAKLSKAHLELKRYLLGELKEIFFKMFINQEIKDGSET